MRQLAIATKKRNLPKGKNTPPPPAAESEAKEAQAGSTDTQPQGTDGTASDSQLGTAPQSAEQGENTQGAEPSENNTTSEGDSE